MKKFLHHNQSGAAVLITAIIVAAGVVSIALSVMLVSLNNNAALKSFTKAVQSFYTAESAVGDSLMQIRREPDNLTFADLSLNNIVATTEFVESGGSCTPPPECDFALGSGWWGEYFNYLGNLLDPNRHPDMQVDPYPGPTATPTQHDWYDDTYKTHEQIDANLMFGDNWFPYDGTIWENKEGYVHDYHFGSHWRARVTAPSAGNYTYALSSDDDQWVSLAGGVVVNNSGIHAAFVKTGSIALATGDNLVEVYFAERHTTGSAMTYKFDDTNLIITPWPEGCGETFECRSNIESTASATEASRKVLYSCDENLANCLWDETAP